MLKKAIDIHAHIYPEKIREKAVAAIGDFYSIPMKESGSMEELILKGNAAGIERFCVHSVATAPKTVSHINDFLHSAAEQHPQFIAFATLHPHMENIEEEVERVIKLGFAGIKVHPDFQEFYIDEEIALPIYAAIEGKLPILFHMGDKDRPYSQPHRLFNILDKFPRLTVIAAHMGGYTAWDEADRYLKGSNVYYDTSSTMFAVKPDEMRDRIRSHGVDKVLFGTDFPMWSPIDEINNIAALRLTEEEEEKVLYKNAAKLLGLE